MNKILFTLLFFCLSDGLFAQCKPDKVPPLLVPKGHFEVALGGDKCVAYVNPAQFLSSVTDNCCPVWWLRLGVRRAGTGSGFPPAGRPLQLTAADMGAPVVVEVWAADTSGNASRVYSSVSVTNPTGCVFQLLPDTLCALSGGNGLEDLTWKVETDTPSPPTGIFEVNSCLALSADLLAGPYSGYRYRITPVKDNDPLNGVSTFDLVLISRYMLGVDTFKNPYQIIAADADRNGMITMNDLIELRKLILGIYTDLPDNTSWRFVPSDFEFPFPKNPFFSAVPEWVEFDSTRKTPLPDMVAIKVGDVNASAVINSLVEAEDRAPAWLRMQDQALAAGDHFSVPVWPDNAGAPDGFQFALSFDPALLEITGLRAAGLTDFSDAHYFFAEPGLLTASWANVQQISSGTDGPLFYLEGRVVRETTLQQAISLRPERLAPEWYDKNGGTAALALQFLPMPLPAATRVGAAFPNPGHAAVTIPLELARDALFHLEVISPDGRVLYRRQETLAAGRRHVVIPAGALETYSGVLWYKISLDDALYQGRLWRY